jgi:hypothetical protein
MSKSIDFETQDYDNQDIVITGIPDIKRTNFCPHDPHRYDFGGYEECEFKDYDDYEWCDDCSYCTKCCTCSEDRKELEPVLRMEKKLYQKGKNMMAKLKNKINDTEKSMIVSGIRKYPRTIMKFKNIIEVGTTSIRKKNSENLYFINGSPTSSMDNITFFCGPFYITHIPNTPGNRYEILYREIMKSKCKKIFDVLINIIIDYLVFDRAWADNFFWKFQLLDNYS